MHERDGYPVEGVADPLFWLSPTGLINAWVATNSASAVGHSLITAPKPTDDAAALWIEQSHEPASSIAVLGRLFVGPEGRNRGAGEQLTRAAMDYGAERNLRLVLDVMEKDKAAIRLYERLGWLNIGSTRHKFGIGQETSAQCYVSPPLS
ncbi:GNAT family N-acetyltransferase [Nocardia nova]|uniref:GNAT family N-acetyltransferase n=1 Tax=Nocardia nova TaxID=37330 RepID=UPI003409A199